jgi:rare lipoprotein A
MSVSAARASATWRSSAAALGLLALSACSVTAHRPPAPAHAPQPAPPAPPVRIDGIPDAVPRAEPRSAHGNPPFYDVLGQRYYVLATADGYLERGVASWYGPTFHGGNTSSGEPYDMYGMTAAHKTLPLPCYARITNLRNGRSVVVRINDRGPFVKGRVLDLSYGAARALHLIGAGVGPVEFEVLPGIWPPGYMASAASMGGHPTHRVHGPARRPDLERLWRRKEPAPWGPLAARIDVTKRTL